MRHIYNCTGHELKLPAIVESRGIYLTDHAGKRYVDLESGVWCTALGHNHPRIAAVIREQMDSLMHAGYCYSHPVVDRAAERLLPVCGLTDGACVFLCSGSEAIELARQIAKFVTQKPRSMTLSDSYLGSYSSVTNRTSGWYLFDWGPCQTCPQIETCDPECPRLAEIPDDISEFIFEPGSSGGFVRFAPRALIHNIASLVRGNGGLVLANEVTTGLGRTGKWLGHQHYGLTPNLIALGKGLGNGYPVSACVISPELLARLQGSGFKYVQSHQNDPMGAAVAHEVLKVMAEENLVEQAASKGRWLLERLTALVDGRCLTAVRGRGLMLALELASVEEGDRIYESLLNSGYIVCNRKGLFRVDPPLITPQEELEGFIGALQKAMG